MARSGVSTQLVPKAASRCAAERERSGAAGERGGAHHTGTPPTEVARLVRVPAIAGHAPLLVGGHARHARGAVVGMEHEGKTVVAVFRRSRLVGLVALRDEPREDAARAVQQLKALGIASVMLTGDNRRTATAISAGLGIEHRAELMPEDKVAAIREMTATGHVMMVGDGINDAPALATAHIGVAMGSGTDVALETADAAILRNRVTDVAGKIRLARAAMANIRQNVAIALGLKAVFLVTTILGITGLWS